MSWLVLIQVTGPDGRSVHNTNTIDGEQFEFIAHHKGRYKFCFHNPLSAPEQVTFYIHVGHVPGIAELAKDGNDSYFFELHGSMVSEAELVLACS